MTKTFQRYGTAVLTLLLGCGVLVVAVWIIWGVRDIQTNYAVTQGRMVGAKTVKSYQVRFKVKRELYPCIAYVVDGQTYETTGIPTQYTAGDTSQILHVCYYTKNPRKAWLGITPGISIMYGMVMGGFGVLLVVLGVGSMVWHSRRQQQKDKVGNG